MRYWCDYCKSEITEGKYLNTLSDGRICPLCDGDTWRLYISEFDAKEDICRNKTIDILCAASSEPPPDDYVPVTEQY